MTDIPLSVEVRISRWKQTVRDYVEDIGSWREQPAEKMWYDRWRPISDNFAIDSTFLIGWINAHYQSVDTAPLHAVYKAVSSWGREHNADGIPDQMTLEGQLEESLVILTSIAIESEEKRRLQRPDVAVPRVPASSAQSGDDAPSLEDTNWWHRPNEEPPSRYSHGPIVGTKQKLGVGISGDNRVNNRTLEQDAQKQLVWVRRPKWNSFEVFFQTHDEFTRVNAEMISRKTPSRRK